MSKENLIEFTKDTRIFIHQMINTVKTVYCPEAGRELSLTVTNLQLGKMWLGKALKAIGNPNPYPESRNPGSSQIEKAADSTPDLLFVGLEPISAIKFLRERLGATIKSIADRESRFAEETLNNPQTKNINEIDFDNVGYVLKQLTEADMWLGMALGAIKDEQEKVNIN